MSRNPASVYMSNLIFFPKRSLGFITNLLEITSENIVVFSCAKFWCVSGQYFQSYTP